MAFKQRARGRLLREETLSVLPTGGKNVFLFFLLHLYQMMGVNQTYRGNHLTRRANQTTRRHPLNLYSELCPLSRNETEGGKEKSSPVVRPPCFKRVLVASIRKRQGSGWNQEHRHWQKHTSASVQPWAAVFVALGLSVPVCEMGTTTGPTYHVGSWCQLHKIIIRDCGWQNNGPQRCPHPDLWNLCNLTWHKRLCRCD